MRRVCMFLGLLDPDLELLVTGMDPGSGSGSYLQAKIVRAPFTSFLKDKKS
jgi:hypothetical protein